MVPVDWNHVEMFVRVVVDVVVRCCCAGSGVEVGMTAAALPLPDAQGTDDLIEL